MTTSDIKATMALRKEAHDYVTKHFDKFYALTFGDESDLVTQGIAAVTLFDVCTAVGLNAERVDHSAARAATVMIAAYMQLYADRQKPE